MRACSPLTDWSAIVLVTCCTMLGAVLDYADAAVFSWEELLDLFMTGTSQRGPFTILLADDEALLRELGETILKQAGYKVMSVHRRQDLESLLHSDGAEIDVLLTDIVMPEISGQELASQVRGRWPGVRVIYTSGYPGDELKDMPRDAAFLQKPFTPAELMAKIREVLAR